MVVVVVVDGGLVTLVVVVDGLFVELHEGLLVVEVEPEDKDKEFIKTHVVFCTIKKKQALRSIKAAPRREILYASCAMEFRRTRISIIQRR